MDSNINLLRITDNLPEAILALNVEGDIIFANSAFESNVAPYDRVQNLPFVEEFISGVDQNRFMSAFYSAINIGGTSFPVKKCNTLCFGQNDIPLYKLVDWTISGSMRESGGILVSGRILEDIESKNTENELIEFFQNSPVALHWLNAKGVIVWANKAELRMLGYSANEYLGHYMSEFCPEDAGLLQTILSHMHIGGRVSNETIRFRTKDGRTKYLLFDANANYDPTPDKEDQEEQVVDGVGVGVGVGVGAVPGAVHGDADKTIHADGECCNVNGGGDTDGAFHSFDDESSSACGAGMFGHGRDRDITTHPDNVSDITYTNTEMYSEGDVLRIRHIRCFLREDTDKLIMDAILSYERHNTLEEHSQRLGFIGAVSRAVKASVTRTDQFLSHCPSIPMPLHTSVRSTSMPMRSMSIPGPSSSHDLNMSLKRWYQSQQTNTAATSTSTATATGSMAGVTSQVPRQELMHSIYLMDMVQYGLHSLLPEPKCTQRMRLQSTIECMAQEAWCVWRRAGQEEVRCRVRTGSSGMDQASGESHPVRLTEPGPIPDIVFAHTGLRGVLRYLFAVATAFSPDDAEIAVDVVYTEVLPMISQNLEASLDMMRADAGVGPGGVGVLCSGMQQMGVSGAPAPVAVAAGGGGVSGWMHPVHGAQSAPAQSSSMYSFCIRHQCVLPMNADAVHEVLSNHDCELPLYGSDFDEVTGDEIWTDMREGWSGNGHCASPEQLREYLSSSSLKLGLFVASSLVTMMEGVLKFSVINNTATFWFSIPLELSPVVSSSSSSVPSSAVVVPVSDIMSQYINETRRRDRDRDRVRELEGNINPATARSVGFNQNANINPCNPNAVPHVPPYLATANANCHGGSSISPTTSRHSSISSTGSNSSNFLNAHNINQNSCPSQSQSQQCGQPAHAPRNALMPSQVPSAPVLTNIPLPPSSAAAMPTVAKSKPMRILVVDDSVLCQKVLTQALRKMGFTTTVADNGRAALDRLVHVPLMFDAVIMDVIMPVMDGYTATKICRHELHLTIPIFVLSADVLPDTRVSMLGLGASAFITKPVKLFQMVSVLHDFNIRTEGSTKYIEYQEQQRLAQQQPMVQNTNTQSSSVATTMASAAVASSSFSPTQQH